MNKENKKLAFRMTVTFILGLAWVFTMAHGDKIADAVKHALGR